MPRYLPKVGAKVVKLILIVIYHGHIRITNFISIIYFVPLPPEITFKQ